MPEEYKIYHTNEATERRWQQLSYEAFYLQAGLVCYPACPCWAFWEHHTEAEVIMPLVYSSVFPAFWRALLEECGGMAISTLGYHCSSSPLWKGASGTHLMPISCPLGAARWLFGVRLPGCSILACPVQGLQSRALLAVHHCAWPCGSLLIWSSGIKIFHSFALSCLTLISTKKCK